MWKTNSILSLEFVYFNILCCLLVYRYNTVISAWSNSDDEDSVQRAVALLDRMLARAEIKKSNPKPDTRTYNTVLHAWSRSNDRNAPIKALGLLELMFRYYENGNEDARPDIVSFSTVINAFSKSNFTRKAQECRNLLRRMQKIYDDGQVSMKPNVFVYSAVLNACAYTFGRGEEKEEALNIGLETWKEMKNSGIRPNHVAYGSFLRTCRRLMEDDSRRTNTISCAFDQCCVDGQLGIYMFKQIRADPKLYVSLLHDYLVDGEVEFNDVRSYWFFLCCIQSTLPNLNTIVFNCSYQQSGVEMLEKDEGLDNLGKGVSATDDIELIWHII